jgi:hypothetical protein
MRRVNRLGDETLETELAGVLEDKPVVAGLMVGSVRRKS